MYAEERRFRTTGLNFFTNEDKRAKLPDWSRRQVAQPWGLGRGYRQLEAEYFLDLSKQTYS